MAIDLSELESRIASGDMEAINAAISGEMFDGGSLPAIVPEETDPPAVILSDDIPATEVDKDSLRDELVRIERERAAERRALNEELEAKQAAMEELARAAEAKEEEMRLLRIEQARKKTEPAPDPITLLDESEEDPELISSFAKNTRKLVESLGQKLNKSETDQFSQLLERLDKVERADKERAAVEETKSAERAQDEARDKVFNDVDGFVERNPEFKFPKKTKEMYKDYIKFRGELKEYLGTTDENEVNRSLYAVAYGETVRDKALREVVEKSGTIKIPEGLDKYMDLVQLTDRQSGLQVNKETGAIEPIVDAYGAQVRYKSVEEAYRVSHYWDKLTEARKNAALQFQQKMDVRASSATVLPDNMTIESERAKKSGMAAHELLALPAEQIKSNPELMKRYNEVLKELGV